MTYTKISNGLHNNSSLKILQTSQTVLRCEKKCLPLCPHKRGAHIEVVAAVIRRGNEIFATQRGYGDFKDWWEFPGGRIS